MVLILLPRLNALNAQLAHQAFNSAAGDLNLLTLHRVPQFACAIDGSVLLPNLFHLFAQIRVPLGAIRCPLGITLDGNPFIESRRSNLQNPADRLDPVQRSR